MYDYWFTQFDFPDENGKPYKSSGGKMVWNVQLKRDIPVGRQVKPLSRIIKKNVEAFDYSSIQPAIDLSVMPSNSIARELFENKTPFELMTDKYSKKLLTTLNLESVPPDKVTLRPTLILGAVR